MVALGWLTVGRDLLTRPRGAGRGTTLPELLEPGVDPAHVHVATVTVRIRIRLMSHRRHGVGTSRIR